jgi:hypothetical protein
MLAVHILVSIPIWTTKSGWKGVSYQRSVARVTVTVEVEKRADFEEARCNIEALRYLGPLLQVPEILPSVVTVVDDEGVAALDFAAHRAPWTAPVSMADTRTHLSDQPGAAAPGDLVDERREAARCREPPEDWELSRTANHERRSPGSRDDERSHSVRG